MNKILCILILSGLIFSSLAFSGCLDDIDEEPDITDENGPDDFDHSRYTKVGITADIVYRPNNDTFIIAFIEAISNDPKFYNSTNLSNGDYLFYFEFDHLDPDFNVTYNITHCKLLVPKDSDKITFEVEYYELIPKKTDKPQWYDKPEKHMKNNALFIVIFIRAELQIEPFSEILYGNYYIE